MNKVDVLAVMDKLHEAVDALGREGELRYKRDGLFHLELGPKHYSSMMLQDELIEARAAVAELIEALPDLLCLYRLKWGNLDPDANKVYQRAEAAHARIAGDA